MRMLERHLGESHVTLLKAKAKARLLRFVATVVDSIIASLTKDLCSLRMHARLNKAC
jgi:hypothetical protein